MRAEGHHDRRTRVERRIAASRAQRRCEQLRFGVGDLNTRRVHGSCTSVNLKFDVRSSRRDGRQGADATSVGTERGDLNGRAELCGDKDERHCLFQAREPCVKFDNATLPNRCESSFERRSILRRKLHPSCNGRVSRHSKHLSDCRIFDRFRYSLITSVTCVSRHMNESRRTGVRLQSEGAAETMQQ